MPFLTKIEEILFVDILFTPLANPDHWFGFHYKVLSHDGLNGRRGFNIPIQMLNPHNKAEIVKFFHITSTL